MQDKASVTAVAGLGARRAAGNNHLPIGRSRESWTEDGCVEGSNRGNISSDHDACTVYVHTHIHVDMKLKYMHVYKFIMYDNDVRHINECIYEL